MRSLLLPRAGTSRPRANDGKTATCGLVAAIWASVNNAELGDRVVEEVLGKLLGW